MRTEGRIDRQTDMTKVMGAFRDYASAPNQLKCVILMTVFLILL